MPAAEDQCGLSAVTAELAKRLRTSCLGVVIFFVDLVVGHFIKKTAGGLGIVVDCS